MKNKRCAWWREKIKVEKKITLRKDRASVWMLWGWLCCENGQETNEKMTRKVHVSLRSIYMRKLLNFLRVFFLAASSMATSWVPILHLLPLFRLQSVLHHLVPWVLLTKGIRIGERRFKHTVIVSKQSRFMHFSIEFEVCTFSILWCAKVFCCCVAPNITQFSYFVHYTARL